MGLKKYIGFGLFFIILLGVYVYSFEGGKYTLNVVDVPITLPIAVWIVLPVILLFLATIFHLMFYGTKNMMKLRRVKKDGEKFTQAAKEALLGKEINAEYKSEIFKLPGAILPLLNSDPYKAKKYRIYNDEVQDILEVKERLENGEIVDLSKYNLKDANPNVLKNALNQLEQDRTYATTILQRCDDKEVCKKAFLKFATYAPMSDLMKYQIEPSREVFNILIDRIGANEDALELSDEEIINYIKELDYKSEDFITLLKKLRKKMVPDRLIHLAEKLAHEFPNEAGEGYLYVLFELQMIDDAREFLANAPEEEYQKFHYLLFLKDQGRNFDTELFV
jgi:hypothetical protein